MDKEKYLIDFLREKLVQIKRSLPKEFPLDDNFKEKWNLDSLSLVELVARIEQHFRIEISDSEIKEFVTLRKIVDCLMQKEIDFDK